MKAALAGMLAAATVGVSAGGVAVLNPSQAHPVPSHIAAAAGLGSTTAGDVREHEQSTDAAEPAEAPEPPVSAGDGAETGDKTVADTQSETASDRAPSSIHDRDGRWRQRGLGGHDHNHRTATPASPSPATTRISPDPERLATLGQWSRQPRVVAGGSTIAAAMR